MMKRMIGSLLLLALVGVSCAGSEIWLVPDLRGALRGNTKWEYIPEMRMKEGGLYYLQNYLGINQQFDKNWEGNIYYALKFQQSGGAWPSSNLGIADLIYKNSWLKNRLRLEQDLTRGLLKYREALQFKIANWSIGDEIFFNTKYGYLDEGRSTMGYSHKLGKSAEATIGYLLRRQKLTISSDWLWTGVLNMGFKLDI